MASERDLHAKEKRRPGLSRTGESVDYPFLLLVLLLRALQPALQRTGMLPRQGAGARPD